MLERVCVSESMKSCHGEAHSLSFSFLTNLFASASCRVNNMWLRRHMGEELQGKRQRVREAGKGTLLTPVQRQLPHVWRSV